MSQKDPDERYHGANGVYLDLVEYLMTTAHSVELSEELGDFIRNLFDYDAAADSQSPIQFEQEAQIDEQDEIQALAEELKRVKIIDEPIIEVQEPEIQSGDSDTIIDVSGKSSELIVEIDAAAGTSESENVR